jgi:SAM-dependent methyltransferase
MPRPGELTYYERIGDAGRRHAVGKPFSDDESGLYLLRAGALLLLLPSPPARILDCGCGTGWLSYFLAQRGYDVVGIDVSADAIDLARANPVFARPLDPVRGARFGEGPERTPTFAVADSESLMFNEEFDAVVYFDSLHHAIDETAALRSAFRALRRGGMCLALEPGRGHGTKSAEVDEAFDITDKDMPPLHVCRVGRSVGFARTRVAPAPQHLGKALFGYGRVPGWRGVLLGIRPLRHLIVHGIMLWQGRYCGIAILHKD